MPILIQPQPIPKLLHRIWFGSFLPPNYRDNLIRLKQDNPTHTVKLWTDLSTLSLKETKQFVAFCNQYAIELHNIRDYTTFTNLDLITEELDESANTIKNKRARFARASDLARIAILIAQGGLYTDTDTDSLKALPPLMARFGLLLKEFPAFTAADQATCEADDIDGIFYDFIAAAPSNDILQLTALISRNDYRTYHKSSHTLWETSTSQPIVQRGTVRLTGSALRWALLKMISHQEIIPTQRQDLFFADKTYLSSTYDQSWLEKQTQLSTDAEFDALTQFQDEIAQHRASAFPLNFTYMAHKFAKQINPALMRLEAYTVNDKVHPEIIEMKQMLVMMQSDRSHAPTHPQSNNMSQQVLLQSLLQTLNQLDNANFESKKDAHKLIGFIRETLNEVTCLFTEKKDNHNRLAQKMIRRPSFFLVTPKTAPKRAAIESQVGQLEESKNSIKKCPPP